MKRYIIISMLALAACGETKKENSENQLPTSIVNNPYTANGMDTAVAAMKPVMEFKDTTHNFGTLHEGEVAAYDFSFVNKGKSPLIITSASGSCGCTVADYPRDPILPNQAATLKVTFNSQGKSGHQEKSVTLQTNTVRSVHMLYIQAEVESKK